LALVHEWSLADRYLPVQNMDVLTILGFVILAGVVVNNAILIVHQTLNLLNADGASMEDRDSRREAITQAVSSRVRPILMSTLTSVGGMLPLVLMPGSGSELYRGLGAVVVGGLAVSTVFTLILVPVVLSVVFDLTAAVKAWSHRRAGTVVIAG
jgi:HAE1 family hydrophobic/amphiphilic exporter-1